MAKLVYSGLVLLVLLLPSDLRAACLSSIPFNTVVTDSWEANCPSEHRADRYAKYYTFTLSSSQEVTIDLQSSTDTYLFLLSGSNQTGTILEQDDDSGTNRNSRIVRTLSPGTYTAEVTTFAPLATGEFTISVNLNDQTSGICSGPIEKNTSLSDAWRPGCLSEHRADRYARYYTFTLLGTHEVTIRLESSVDTYLFLLEGSNRNGSVLAEDNDSGRYTDSRMVRTLPAGTYTIEATTVPNQTIGAFLVSVSASTCSDCPFQINAGVNDAWFSATTSGQGFTMIVFPEIKQMFVTWFTFDTERPPEDVTAILGDPGHRWLTAQGPYDGDTATLTIYSTEGGVFDSAEPATSTDQSGDGTLTLKFADCTEALAIYEITSLNMSGEIPLERIVHDNLPLCEVLSNP